MKPLKWPTDAEMHAYMKMRHEQNHAAALKNPNENWMAEELANTGLSWKRQAEWGYRLFDFWCHEIGVAIEIDGREHNHDYDAYRDEYNFRRSGLVVLRVRNKNDADAQEALNIIGLLGTWEQRRITLGLFKSSKLQRRKMAALDYSKSLLKEYLAEIKGL